MDQVHYVYSLCAVTTAAAGKSDNSNYIFDLPNMIDLLMLTLTLHEILIANLELLRSVITVI